MRKTIIAVACFCAWIGNSVFADDTGIKEDAPDRHVVVKGDTLWGISGKFLKDPWRWPDVWKLNQDEIKNPHRIYPGDVVLLDRANGSLKVLQGRQVVKLSPGMRATQLEPQAIPAISPADIGPFLSQPLVIEAGGLDNAPRIVAQEERRVVIGAGSRAYASGVPANGSRQWQIFRPGKALIDPETNQVLGHEAIYLGEARVIKSGEPTTIEITKAVQEINRDDRLVQPANIELSNITPHAPAQLKPGRIVSAYGAVAESGRGSIITINRGQRDGIENGHVVALYRLGDIVPLPAAKDEKKNPMRFITAGKCLKPGAKISYGEPYDPSVWGPCPEDMAGPKSFGEPYDPDPKANTVTLPNERYGLALVFRTFDKVSYALVMQSSLSVHVADVIQKP